MCEFIENIRGNIDPVIGTGLAKVNDVVGHHHHLFNIPWQYDILSQSIQQVQPPQADHVVHGDGVSLGRL